MPQGEKVKGTAYRLKMAVEMLEDRGRSGVMGGQGSRLQQGASTGSVVGRLP